MSCLRSRCAGWRLPRAGGSLALTVLLALAAGGAAGCASSNTLPATRSWADGEHRAAPPPAAATRPTDPMPPEPVSTAEEPAAAPVAIASPSGEEAAPPSAAAAGLPAALSDGPHSGSASPADQEPFTLVTAEPPLTKGTAPAPAATAAHPAAKAVPHTYVVQPGDTLASIAHRVYGEEKAWTRLYDANRDQLPDAKRLKPGMTLRLP